MRNDSLIQSSIFKIEDKVWAFFGHQRLCMRSDALIACCCMGSTVLKNFLAFPKLGLGLRSPMFFLLKAGFEIGILEHLLACGTESTCFVNLVFFFFFQKMIPLIGGIRFHIIAACESNSHAWLRKHYNT